MAEETMEEPKRRGKKKRKNKIGFYSINVILGVVIVIVLTIFLVLTLCQEKKVTVKGNTIYSSEEVENLILKDTWSKRNCVYAVVKNLIQPQKNVPFIDKATVKMTGRNSLRITVTETPMVGYLALADGKTYAYFDASGTVTDVSDRLVEGLPQLNGITAKKASVGKVIPSVDESDRKTIASVFQYLKTYNISVTSVTFAENGEISAQYADITLNLGTRSDLKNKIARLPYILPQLEGMTGTLHLENWTQENTDIIFEKADEQAGQ